MLEAITAAEDYIHLETYILHTDKVGRQFLSALSERARAGVDVRLLYDAVGSRGIEAAPLDSLRAAGGEVLAFNPVGRRYPSFAPRRRDHRKILIVDGRIGFTGGLNIGDEYAVGIAGSAEEEWRDAHVRMTGPAIRDLAAVFLESWFRANGPDLPWSSLLRLEAEGEGQVRCAVLADGPVYQRRRMREVIVSALEEVEHEALLASPYFSPGRRVLDALAQASDRGVRVELLLAGRTDHPIFRRAAHAMLPRLLAAGIECHEYDRAMLHAKLAVFDVTWAILGTSNLDRQSFERNFEVNVLLEGGKVAEKLRARFGSERSGARRVDLESLAARGPVERFVDWLASRILFFVA